MHIHSRWILAASTGAFLLLATGRLTAYITPGDFLNLDSSSHTSSSAAGTTFFASGEQPWTCGSPFTDSRDGNVYATIQIGSQCWMKNNMNIGLMLTDGVLQSHDCATIHKYCYEDQAANCTTDGGLYAWHQAMCDAPMSGGQGICPAGWHIPTHDEWTTLEQAVCTSENCTTDFPFDTTTLGWRGSDEGMVLRDAAGFAGQLGGLKDDHAAFAYRNTAGYFWTSTVNAAEQVWRRTILADNNMIERTIVHPTVSYSVRCVHGAGPTPSSVPLPTLMGQSSATSVPIPVLIGQSSATSVLIPVLIGQSSSTSSSFDTPLPSLPGLQVPLPTLPLPSVSSSSILLPILTPKSSASSATATKTITKGGGGTTQPSTKSNTNNTPPHQNSNTTSKPSHIIAAPAYDAYYARLAESTPHAAYLAQNNTITVPSVHTASSQGVTLPTHVASATSSSLPKTATTMAPPAVPIHAGTQPLPASGSPYVFALLLMLPAGWLVLRSAHRAEQR